MLALEIPMGVAAAGPLAMPQDRLEAMVGNVLKLERGSKTTVH